MGKLAVSFVFPVCNEEEFLEERINQFLGEISKTILGLYEVILVENGSSDRSWEIVRTLARKHSAVKALRLDYASYGQAMRLGMLASKGKYIVIYNVDFYDIEFFKESLKLLNRVDVVVGSKTLAASQDNRSLSRKLTTYFFNAGLRLILNYPGTDTHGIKAFKNNKELHRIILKCRAENELFDTELVIRLSRDKKVLAELPVKVRELRPSRYSFWKRIWFTMADLKASFLAKYVESLNGVQITADDYGIGKRVNKEIIKKAIEQKVSVVSILPNMVTETQVKQLKQLKGVKFAAHINLIEGRPLNSSIKVPSLVKKDGSFCCLPLFLLRFFLGKISIKEVEKEVEVQLKRLLFLGIKINQIDSHQHVHAFPLVWRVILKTAKKNKIKAVRSFKSVNTYLKAWPVKYAGFRLMLFGLTMRYGENKKSSLEVDEKIVHPGSSYDEKYFGKVIVFVLVAVIVGIVFHKELSLPFYWDTAAFLVPAAEDIAKGEGLLSYAYWGTDYPHTFLLPLMLAGVYRLPIDFIFGAHFLSMIFSGSLLVMVYLVGSYLMNKKTGLAAGLLLLSSPLFLAQTILVYFEIPGMVFRLWSVLCLFKKNYRGFLITALAAFLIRFENGLVLISVGIVYVCLSRIKDKASWMVNYVLPLIIVNAGWYVYHYRLTGWWLYSPLRSFKEDMGLAVRQAITYLFVWQGRGYLVMLGIVLMVYWIKKDSSGLKEILKKFKKETVVLGVLVLWPLGIVAKLGYFIPRYDFAILPVFYLIVAGLVIKMLGKKGRLATGLIVFMLLVQLSFKDQSFAFNKEDSLELIRVLEVKRAASAYLQEFYAGELILVDFSEASELKNVRLGYVSQPLKTLQPDKVFETGMLPCLVYSTPTSKYILSFFVDNYEGEMVALFKSGRIEAEIYKLSSCNEL